MRTIANNIPAAAAISVVVLISASSLLAAPPPSPDQDPNCGGNCQVICVNGCDSNASYSWQQAACVANSLSDTIGPYCNDGYVCGSGACGRAGERACNTAATGCSGCAAGYMYDSNKAYCVVQNASPGNFPTWMGDLGATISSKSLNQIVIPGTHDAASASMTVGAQAQGQTIKQQLDGGIRNFDLRPCYVRGTGIKVCHGPDMTGPMMQTVLNDVRDWIAAHSTEVVILTMANCGEADATSMNQDGFTQLTNMISSTLAGYVPDHTSISPGSTLAAIRSATLAAGGTGNGKVLINFFGTSSCSSNFPATSKWYWTNATSRPSGGWANTTNQTIANTQWKKALDSVRYSNYLFLLDLELTPTQPRVWYPSWLAGDSNPVAIRWIAQEWSTYSYNLIDLDFYENTCIVPLAIWFNKGKPGTFSCYSAWPTGNKTAWDAKVWPY